MELSKQCVSLDIAKRLKELGVKQESLFTHYRLTDCPDGREDWKILETSDSFVVACKTPEEARNTTPGGYHGTWCTPEHVKVELIGKAKEGVSGIVIKSFNAG